MAATGGMNGIGGDHISYRDLLNRIRRGEETAFRELFDAHWRPLVKYALRLRRSEDEAEEAVQAAFIRFWEKREEWTDEGSVRSLLFRITRDTALNMRLSESRRAARHEEMQRRAPTRGATPEEEAERADLESAFREALEQMSDRRREMFNLTRIDGLSYREAAQVLGIAPKTAANHLTGSLSELYEALKEHIGSRPPQTRTQPMGCE